MCPRHPISVLTSQGRPGESSGKTNSKCRVHIIKAILLYKQFYLTKNHKTKLEIFLHVRRDKFSNKSTFMLNKIFY